MTTDPATDRAPVWMPDGKRLVLASVRAGANNLYRQSADGSGAAERLTTVSGSQMPTSITSDGAVLVGNQTLTGFWELFRLPLAPGGVAEPLLDLPGNENYPAVSPNGRFLAYGSDEAGSRQIFVRPFPRVGAARWQVSRDGGGLPKWSRDGRELFFHDLAGRIVGVAVDTSGPTLAVGPPAIVVARSSALRGDASISPFDVSLDGRRFLIVKSSDAPAAGGRIVVWLNPLGTQ